MYNPSRLISTFKRQEHVDNSEVFKALDQIRNGIRKARNLITERQMPFSSTTWDPLKTPSKNGKENYTAWNPKTIKVEFGKEVAAKSKEIVNSTLQIEPIGYSAMHVADYNHSAISQIVTKIQKNSTSIKEQYRATRIHSIGIESTPYANIQTVTSYTQHGRYLTIGTPITIKTKLSPQEAIELLEAMKKEIFTELLDAPST